MAKSSVAFVHQLDDGFIFTPERYDALKTREIKTGVKLKDITSISKETLTSKKAKAELLYLVLDTGDVKEGFIRFKKPVNSEGIGSTKKILEIGDVIISRLRPYLRQVGFVDDGLINALPKGTQIICSTEFYVLRSNSDISFLAPILLTTVHQQILNVSQEGGHHPRFNQETLENLNFDRNRHISKKEDISKSFQKSINNLRSGEQGVLKLLQSLEA